MPSKIISDKDYLFLTAMLRARESKMLTFDGMARMLEASCFDESAKLLTDCGYSDLSGMDSSAFIASLDKHISDLLNELEAISPEPELIAAFRLKYDYHNVKVLIKSEGAHADGIHLLSACGRVAPQTLINAFHSEDFRFIPEAVKDALTEAKGILARTGNPQLSDFAIDKRYFSELLNLSDSLKGSFFSEYVRVLIDSANLRGVIRTLRLGKNSDFLKTALIPGGNVGIERLHAAALSGDGLSSVFSATPFHDASQLGLAAVKGGSMTAFEQGCDNAVTRFMTKAKLVGFGDAPVIAYLYATEREITAIRMILTGKLSGLDSQIILERLRVSYV